MQSDLNNAVFTGRLTKNPGAACEPQRQVTTPQLQRHDDELDDVRRRVDRLERIVVRRRPPA